jgi:tripartite ATP-independent transporter DctP family solute receptor
VPFACNQRPVYRQRAIFDVTVEATPRAFSVRETDYHTEPGPCDHGFRHLGGYAGDADGERFILQWDGGSQTLWQVDAELAELPAAPRRPRRLNRTQRSTTPIHTQETNHMTVTRRNVLRGAAAAATLAVPMGRALAQPKAEFTYKYANNLPLSHPMNQRAKEMADAVRAETNGRVDIQIFPNNQLGSDTDVLSQLRSGGVEFFTLSGLILSTLVPASSISGVGFAFKDYDSVWKAMDGELGAHIRAQIAKANIVAMDKIWDNGFRQITSSTKPIATPADLKGFKIRVPVSPLWTSMFKALDAAPTSINFAEVYSALQTKIVDGQENPLAIISTAKLFEVQKYCSLTNHMWDGFWFLANKKAWDRLPPDLRDIVAKHINAAAVKERVDVAELNAGLQKDLASKGMAFNQPDAAAFRDQLRKAGFYSEWKGRYGDEAWSLLERSVGKLS